MSCHSCGGFEHFTTTMQEMPQQPKSSCMNKETMNKCIYTAQGMFLCDAPVLNKELGVAKNYWMVEDEKAKTNFGLFMQR